MVVVVVLCFRPFRFHVCRPPNQLQRWHQNVRSVCLTTELHKRDLVGWGGEQGSRKSRSETPSRGDPFQTSVAILLQGFVPVWKLVPKSLSQDIKRNWRRFNLTLCSRFAIA